MVDTKEELQSLDESNPERHWNEVNLDLKHHYGEEVYTTWFYKLRFVEKQGNNAVVLSAPSNFIRDWIESNYRDIMLRLWQSHDQCIQDITIITRASKDQDNESPVLHPQGEKIIVTGVSPLDSRFTFENFVVGPPNELAYAASMSIAESDKAVVKSNPLFLYGGVGLGKTHLMHAIAWHCRQKKPNRRILYMSAEKFMYRFIQALRNKDIMTFKEEFRSVDVLMIDDIQFICGKESTQEEFFHTFNAIIDNNKQMVISCDRSPTDLDNIEDRIKSRLGWGLVADVHSTTYELRVGILESKLEKMDINISNNVIHFLASKITSNVRELEGALNKIIAHSAIVGHEVTLETSHDILKDLLRSNERIVTVDTIQKEVAKRYNIRISDMSSSRRLRAVARPRQIAMYLAKTLTPKSLSDIGASFGKKDHTTVIHAVKKIEELMSKDAELNEELHLLTRILQT